MHHVVKTTQNILRIWTGPRSDLTEMTQVDHSPHFLSELTMLKCPFMKTPYIPIISHILGAISIYDLENTIGKELRKYDPNDEEDRKKIRVSFILKDLMYLSYRHRFVLMSALSKALDNPDFDFSKEFKSDYDEYKTMAWDETEIADPRGFFADIYRLANEVWKDDLQKASIEDQSTW